MPRHIDRRIGPANAQTRDGHARLDHDLLAIIVRSSGFPKRWYQSCISGMVSMLCMSIHGVRMFIEPIFREDDMAMKAKKAKKTAKAATKKVAKKTSKKKK